MTQLIYTLKNGSWLGVSEAFTLDVSFGADENDFELTFGLKDAREIMEQGFGEGCFIFVPNTEWGGVVDQKQVNYQSKNPEMKFLGRSWHGILASSVIKPSSGSTHLTLSGDCNDIIRDIVKRQGLQDVFDVQGKSGVTTSFKFPRYIDAYKGLRKMLAACNMRLGIQKCQGKCILSAVPARTFDSGIDNNFLRLKIERNYRPINHLVCLGKGVGTSRVVVDLYADGKGNVSRKQTLFGIDENAEVYNYNNAEQADLIEKGTEKLKDYQKQGDTDTSVSNGMDFYVGDILKATSVDVPVETTTTVSQIIVKIGINKPVSISYKAGTEDAVEIFE